MYVEVSSHVFWVHYRPGPSAFYLDLITTVATVTAKTLHVLKQLTCSNGNWNLKLSIVGGTQNAMTCSVIYADCI
jgi:hypothetical protein